MKAGISNIWILGLMITFLLCFAAYIVVSINYTASFKMKNEVIKIIEKQHGISNHTGKKGPYSIIKTGASVTINNGTMQTINLYLKGNAYTATGSCDNEISTGETWYGMKKLTYKSKLTSADYEKAKKGEKYYYCFAKYEANKFVGGKTDTTDRLMEFRYKVKMFYRFDVPALSEFLSIQVQGTTQSVYDVKDGLKAN